MTRRGDTYAARGLPAGGTLDQVLLIGPSGPAWVVPQFDQKYDGPAYVFTTTPTALSFTDPSPGTGITITGDGVAHFRISYTITCRIDAVVAGTEGYVEVYDNGVPISATRSILGFAGPASNAATSGTSSELVVVPSVGSHTYELFATQTSAGGTLTALLDERTLLAIQLVGF